MSSEVVIRATDLGKGFRAYEHPSHRLKQSLYALAARLTLVPPLKEWFSRRAVASARTFWALRHVNLEVRRGETVGIIGRNGSGKSTLLQIICGTLSASEGTVESTGRIAALLELGSGFDLEFTGRENVYMNGQLHGLTKEQIDERFSDIATFADIGDFLDQPVKTYSSGMFVRLAFAVIAHVDADILIIDEALAVGDAFFTQKCMRFLRKFMLTGTILFVSHDSSAIRSLCTRAMWIDRGGVIDTGEAKDVCNRYLEAYYEAQQGKSKKIVGMPKIEASATETPRRDQRSQFAADVNQKVGNFEFDPTAFVPPSDAALIERVELVKEGGVPLAWTTGGENVTLRVTVQAKRRLVRPVVGFTVKDKLGRVLFGDNTYWITPEEPLSPGDGERLMAAFDFPMPVLNPGDYAIEVAIADASLPDGTLVLHRWHEACFFTSEAASSSTGLVGLPMRKISLEVQHPQTTQGLSVNEYDARPEA